MIATPPNLTIPLQRDDDGGLRVSGTRVLAEVLIAYFKRGYTPDALHETFDVLPLEDIYAVIAYYLMHQEAMDAYIAQRNASAAQLRAEIEASYTPAQRERLAQLKALA